jgi:hypothetical protein
LNHSTIVLTAALVALTAGRAGATPSSTCWTNCSIDFQSFKVGHVTYDNYTTIGEKGPAAGGQQFANDVGLTLGVLPAQKFQVEVGFDWVEPSDHPLFFNAKAGAPEGTLFDGAPALELGLFNMGTKKGVTDQAVVQLITGRTLPGNLGRLHASGYFGNAKLLRSSDGDRENAGFMVAYDRGFLPAASPDGGYNRLVLVGDYASGRNAIGGGSAGFYWFFGKDVSLLGGPVWFNDRGLNGTWKWTTQIDINFGV